MATKLRVLKKVSSAMTVASTRPSDEATNSSISVNPAPGPRSRLAGPFSCRGPYIGEDSTGLPTLKCLEARAPVPQRWRRWALINVILHSILSDERGHLARPDESAGRPGQLNLNHPQITQIRFPSGRRADHLHGPGVIEIVRRWIRRVVRIKRLLETRRDVTRKVDHLIPVEQTDHFHPFLENLDRPDIFAREANLVEPEGKPGIKRHHHDPHHANPDQHLDQGKRRLINV